MQQNQHYHGRTDDDDDDDDGSCSTTASPLMANSNDSRSSLTSINYYSKSHNHTHLHRNSYSLLVGHSNKYNRRSVTSSSETNSNNNNNNKNHVYELKNARDALVGSISAAINFCQHLGVPKASTDQLERSLEMKRYFAVMNRIQNYIGCVNSLSEDDELAKVHLVVTAWELLCRYKAIEYKRSYKYVYLLRDSQNIYNNNIHYNYNSNNSNTNVLLLSISS